jgi:hypothetical protein
MQTTVSRNARTCRVEVCRVLVLQSAQRKSLAPILAVRPLRFDGSPPRRGRSRSVIASRMAGARRAACGRSSGRMVRACRAVMGVLLPLSPVGPRDGPGSRGPVGVPSLRVSDVVGQDRTASSL